MCIYSVKMPCSANGLVISHSEIDLLENDYIQVIDSSRSHAYRPVTGDSWPADQHHYPSSNLKVVFWSDRDTTQGKGFSLQFSCPAAIQKVPSQQIGSGDSNDDLTIFKKLKLLYKPVLHNAHHEYNKYFNSQNHESVIIGLKANKKLNMLAP